jgi:hypothetical protein
MGTGRNFFLGTHLQFFERLQPFSSSLLSRDASRLVFFLNPQLSFPKDDATSGTGGKLIGNCHEDNGTGLGRTIGIMRPRNTSESKAFNLTLLAISILTHTISITMNREIDSLIIGIELLSCWSILQHFVSWSAL